MMIFTLGARIKNLIQAFKARVLSSQGEFEAETCLDVQLTDLDNKGLLDSASLIVTPNGYKENVLFSVTPSPVGTNLLLQSETFENSYWLKSLGTITANDTTAPNGTMTADLFTKTSAVNTVSSVNRSTVYTVTGVYTLSIFIKPKTGNVVLLRMDASNNTANASFNFTTKTFTNSGANFISSSYEELTDGWFRLSMTSNVIATNWVTDVCNLFSNPTGDAMWIWGAQLEEGSTVGNYIPTVTRQAINETICDFTTTRATTGTRVNSDSLIEEVPYNLFQQSETFDNAYWVKQNTTISTNTITAPNGAMTADKVICNSGVTYYYTGPSGVNIVSNSFNQNLTERVVSFYLKYGGLNRIRVMYGGATTMSGNIYVEVDLQLGIITGSNGGSVASNFFIEDAGNGWYRVGFTNIMTLVTTNNRFAIGLGDTTKTVGDGVDGVFVWGAQLVNGIQPKDYFPTTNRFNIPRLDYVDGCPTLLVEQQRTNLFLQSEDFSTSWIPINSTVTPNTTLSPTGLSNADTITSTATSQAIVLQLRTITSGTVYSISFYVKQNTQRFVYIRFTSQSSIQNYVSAVFDLQDGTTGQTSVGTTSGTLISSDVRDAGNGFYRVSITASINVTDGNIGIGFAEAKTGNTFNTSGVITSTITNGNSIFLWGAQMEAGYEPTSYIPTTTGAVTRNGDFIFRDAIQDLIGQTEGSIYCEFSTKYNKNWNVGIFVLRGATTNERIAIRFSSNPARPSGGLLNLIVVAGGTFVVNLNAGTLIPAANQRYKVCATYNQTQQKIYVNGVLVATRTGSYTQPSTLTTVQLAGYSSDTANNGNINLYSGLVFKDVLTDTQAIQLTTL